MTIFFSDIRSFTSISERMAPREVFAMINDYLAAMAPSFEQHGGFIDKFIGDAIMGLFAPGPGAVQFSSVGVRLSQQVSCWARTQSS